MWIKTIIYPGHSPTDIFPVKITLRKRRKREEKQTSALQPQKNESIGALWFHFQFRFYWNYLIVYRRTACVMSPISLNKPSDIADIPLSEFPRHYSDNSPQSSSSKALRTFPGKSLSRKDDSRKNVSRKDVSRIVIFPERLFPDKTFPGQSLSRKDVSRKDVSRKKNFVSEF